LVEENDDPVILRIGQDPDKEQDIKGQKLPASAFSIRAKS
jgi:hypothetical protein